MAFDGKVKVRQNVTTDNIVEANFKNVHGHTLFVKSEWRGNSIPNYTIGANNRAIAYLSNEDLEAYANMIENVQKAVKEVLDGKGQSNT